jgi:tetratricopeptide (TPR) repeat protein
MRIARALTIALLGAVALSSSAVAGEPPAALSPAARATLERGLRSYAVGDWAAAIAAFREGYQREPHPDFLYALAQAQRMSGDCTSAIATYRAFLRTAPSDRQAAPARANLARCEEQLARERAARPSPPPPEAPPPPPPPRASVENPSPPPPWWRDPAGGALLGVGLALTAAGGALWGVGERDIAAINAASTYADRARLLDGADRAEALRTAGVVAVVAGGVALLGGSIRWGVVARRARFSR